jgi:NAD-reducing hydrogenase small subunit
VAVDAFIPGCPPHADLIYRAVADLLDGKTPDLTGTRFG